jgi:DNA polymerase III alpha subunit (gram-positive type)
MTNIFFLDYETTGLNPYSSEVIEIAIKNMGNKTSYNELVIPTRKYGPYRYVSPKITEITTITDELLESEGISLEEAVRGMIDYIVANSVDGIPIYIVAHFGTMFDFIIFRKLMKSVKQTRQISMMLENTFYIDTVLFARLISKDESVSQARLCQRYNVTNVAAHRAYGDIQALEEIYEKICLEYSYFKGHTLNYYIHHPEEINKDTYLI